MRLQIKVTLRYVRRSGMRSTKAMLFLVAAISGSMTAEATNPIRVVRERFANSKAIKLDLEAQEQLAKGDLENAQRTVDLALQADPDLWLTYFTRARIFVGQHKYESAIQDCNRVLLKYPKFIEAGLLRAQANAQLGRYAASLSELDHIVRIRPHLDSYVRALRQRAWFQSTCPDASFRNGQQAIQDAKTACKLTYWKDCPSIDTLATAYAEAGDFDSAVRCEQQAISVNGVSAKASRHLQQRLGLFEQHRPIRIPPT